RNQLKLPDLNEPYDFLRGDALLRLNNRLGARLDGVYRPAEAYQRWLEWFTAIGFGTKIGRFFTRFVFIPFGGAFLLTEALAVLLELLDGPALPDALRLALTLLLGFFLLGLIHVPAFRQRCAETAAAFGGVLYTVFIGWPARVFQLAALRELLGS